MLQNTLVEMPTKPAVPAKIDVPPMKTGKIAKININPIRVKETLSLIELMKPNHAYSKYNLTVDARMQGSWVQTILANQSGNSEEGLSKEHDDPVRWTREGRSVPYVQLLLSQVFRPKHLKSVRIFSARNAIIASHRDYMEFKGGGFRRIHIPLKTNPWAMNSEDDVVYHMTVGGVYFLDGHNAHSGGNLSSCEARIHLVLDFAPHIPVQELFIDWDSCQTNEELETIERPVLTELALDKLIDGWAQIMNPITYPTIFSQANMLPFANAFSADKVYDVIVEAAFRSGNSEIHDLATADRKYFLGR